MMRNKMQDVSDILMEQLERLMEAETDAEVELESKRARQVSVVAGQLNETGRLLLDNAKFRAEVFGDDVSVPMLEMKNE